MIQELTEPQFAASIPPASANDKGARVRQPAACRPQSTARTIMHFGRLLRALGRPRNDCADVLFVRPWLRGTFDPYKGSSAMLQIESTQESLLVLDGMVPDSLQLCLGQWPAASTILQLFPCFDECGCECKKWPFQEKMEIHENDSSLEIQYRHRPRAKGPGHHIGAVVPEGVGNRAIACLDEVKGVLQTLGLSTVPIPVEGIGRRCSTPVEPDQAAQAEDRPCDASWGWALDRFHVRSELVICSSCRATDTAAAACQCFRPPYARKAPSVIRQRQADGRSSMTWRANGQQPTLEPPGRERRSIDPKPHVLPAFVGDNTGVVGQML